MLWQDQGETFSIGGGRGGRGESAPAVRMGKSLLVLYVDDDLRSSCVHHMILEVQKMAIH